MKGKKEKRFTKEDFLLLQCNGNVKTRLEREITH